ncbi:MAG: hypothetical protein U0232_03715 [Thermomicrobiales bacterium]
MGSRRVLLIAAQQDIPPPAAGDDSDYRVASEWEVATILQQQPFDAVVIDGTSDDKGVGALAQLRRIVAARYPAPIVLLVPTGATDLGREALASGAWGCVVRAGDYREQLRWVLDTAVARFQPPQQQAHRAAERAALAEAVEQRQAVFERLQATLQHLYEGVVILDAGKGTVLARTRRRSDSSARSSRRATPRWSNRATSCATAPGGRSPRRSRRSSGSSRRGRRDSATDWWSNGQTGCRWRSSPRPCRCGMGRGSCGRSSASTRS